MRSQHFNQEYVTKKFGGTKVTLQICRIYLQESPDIMEQYRSVVLDPPDYESMAASAHRLKGSVGMLGANELSEKAGLLEMACHAGEEAKALELYDEIDHGLRILRKEVSNYVDSYT